MGVIKPAYEMSGDNSSCCRDPLQTSRWRWLFGHEASMSAARSWNI